jgi:UDP-glucose 4-epimerase
MQKIILITGWVGYIWSHAVVAFEQAGYKCVIVDNLVNSSSKTLEWIEKIIGYKPDFFEVDLREKDKLEEVFKKYDFDWVIHFAWLKAVWESCEKPLEYHDNNIVWSLRLFECMQEFWVQNIIFSSSATVYDSSNFEYWEWVSEIWITWNCSNPYWTTKFVLEQILRDLANFAGFRVMNLRYFNPIWAHKSWYLWEDPQGIPNNLLPYIMKVAVGELETLSVFWDDYDTIDGTWVRDYIDVLDLIDGHLKAYEKIWWEKWFFEVYNLGTWKWVSVLEMIEASEKVTWKKIKYKIVWRRDWDLASVFCNPTKAFNELWWKSRVSLKESLENSWKFYNK